MGDFSSSNMSKQCESALISHLMQFGSVVASVDRNVKFEAGPFETVALSPVVATTERFQRLMAFLRHPSTVVPKRDGGYFQKYSERLHGLITKRFLSSTGASRPEHTLTT